MSFAIFVLPQADLYLRQHQMRRSIKELAK